VTRRELYRLAHQIYAGLRTGHIDAEVAFDFATLVMDTGSGNPAAAELAAVATEAGSRERIADLSRQLLTDIEFEPDFTDEPGWLAAFQQALAIVQADLRATGLDGTAGMVMHEGSRVLITFGGHWGSTSGIPPAEGSNQVKALAAVADELQDAVMDQLMSAWPLCAVHGYGAHARAHENTAVWWCNGSGGHVIAPIGQLK
jgi:hypothetical protein